MLVGLRRFLTFFDSHMQMAKRLKL